MALQEELYDVQVEIVELELTYTSPFTIELDAGIYTLRATWLTTGEVIQRTVTITEGVTTSEDFYFTGAPPPEEYVLTVATTTGGTTNPVPDSYTHPANASVNVTAVPYTNYYFDRWLLDGIEYTTNPITVVMDSDHSLVAYFTEEEPPPPETYNLNISTTIGGTTNPEPGIYVIEAGNAIDVLAIPNTGYVFDHFELDGVYDDLNPKTVFMDKDHALLAVFKQKPPPPVPLTKVALGVGAVAATGTVVYVGTRR